MAACLADAKALNAKPMDLSLLPQASSPAKPETWFYPTIQPIKTTKPRVEQDETV